MVSRVTHIICTVPSNYYSMNKIAYWAHSVFWELVFSFFLNLYISLLRDNCFTELCLFLPNITMNQPQVHMCPLPLEPPSHLPPHPTPLGCYRALVWVPWNIQQIPTGYLRNKHWPFHIILQDSNSITAEMDIFPFLKRGHTQKEKLPTLGVVKLQKIRVTGRLTETQIAGPLTTEVSDSVGLGCELDHKEGWALKNWCLWTEMLRRLLRILGTARRSNQSNLKEINPGYSLEGLML